MPENRYTCPVVIGRDSELAALTEVMALGPCLGMDVQCCLRVRQGSAKADC